MSDGKLLDGDRDEWFYQSLKKYTNLYMFELEFPLDTLEIINETSLCVSGIQAYSKQCELLQLCVPPKLLRDESEEGLCKDRDFKILSGGYADGRIRQVKFIKSSSNLVGTYQDGYNGIVVYEVGDDDRATIAEKCRLPANENASAAKSMGYMKDKILLGYEVKNQSGVFLSEWSTNINSVKPDITQTHQICSKDSSLELGHVVKIRDWDENACIFMTSSGTVVLYDLRCGNGDPQIMIHATKSAFKADAASAVQGQVIFTFDCLPNQNLVGILDSCGGYETFDSRAVNQSGATSTTEGSQSVNARVLLPQFEGLGGVYADSFNIEYEARTKVRENEQNRFIISGLKKEGVPVLREIIGTSSTEDVNNINPVFSHDGHSKPVTHARWHPAADNLIFSASLDAVLHAWQFIPDE